MKSQEDNDSLLRLYNREKYSSGLDIQFREPIRIGFIGICGSSGTTSIVQSYARFLSGETKLVPAVVEISSYDRDIKPYPYDKLGMGKRFVGREYISFLNARKRKMSYRKIKNIDDGINWCLCDPNEKLEYAKADIIDKDWLRLINAIPGDMVICDIDSESIVNDDYRDILTAYDVLILVIEPLPSKLLAGFDILNMVKSLEIQRIPVLYLINRVNPRVDLKEVRRFLHKNKTINIPDIESAVIYEAEYKCKTMIDIRKGRGILEGPFTKLTEEIKTIFEKIM